MGLATGFWLRSFVCGRRPSRSAQRASGPPFGFGQGRRDEGAWFGWGGRGGMIRRSVVVGESGPPRKAGPTGEKRRADLKVGQYIGADRNLADLKVGQYIGADWEYWHEQEFGHYSRDGLESARGSEEFGHYIGSRRRVELAELAGAGRGYSERMARICLPWILISTPKGGGCRCPGRWRRESRCCLEEG